MQAWYHCENVYPFVPKEVLDSAGWHTEAALRFLRACA